MTSVAPSPPEQGQLVSVRSRQRIVNDVRPSTLHPTALKPLLDSSGNLDAFFGSMRSGAAFTADVKNIRSSIHSDIDSDEGLPVLFESEEPPAELRAVEKKATREEKCAIPANMRVESSVIHRLFVDEAAGDGACQEDLSCWEPQGKKQEGRAVAVEARSVADWMVAIVQPLEAVGQKRNEANAHSLFTV